MLAKHYTFAGMSLPAHLQESLEKYVTHRIPTGGFLRACLENDLKEAVGRADAENMLLLPVIAAYMYNEMPSVCQGSFEKVREWLQGPI